MQQLLKNYELELNTFTVDLFCREMISFQAPLTPENEEILSDDFEKMFGDIDVNEEVKDYKTLSLEILVLDFQKNESNVIFEKLFEAYDDKLKRFSNRQNDGDIYPEMLEVLWRAAKTFSINGGAKFNTYFWKCAKNHMGLRNTRKKAKKRTAEFGVVSLHQTVSYKGNENEMEMETLIEDKSISSDFENSEFYTFLKTDIFPNLKDSEIRTIELLLNGYTLEEIGEDLNGITAPAVHMKLRRLADKKVVGKHFKELYNQYYK